MMAFAGILETAMSKHFEMTRVYAKRETEKSDWAGAIGSATWEIESKSDVTMRLDGKELGANAIAHLMNFALQTLQDAYAGAVDLNDAKGRFEKKRDAILNGTIGVRASGDGESETLRVTRKIVREKLKKNAEKWAAFEKLDDDAKNTALDTIAAKNATALQPEIDAEIARLAEMRRLKGERLATKVDLDF